LEYLAKLDDELKSKDAGTNYHSRPKMVTTTMTPEEAYEYVTKNDL
jgi:hypothetical protein